MASTTVEVFPVPGGPNIKKGEGLEDPETMCSTACF